MPEGRSLGALATALGASLEGDPTMLVRGVAPLGEAGPDQISFVTSSKAVAEAQSTRAGALVVSKEFSGAPCALLRCDDPQLAVIMLLRVFHPALPVPPGVHPTAIVSDSATIDQSARIGPCAVVEAGARIGAEARLFPYVYIGEGSVVGDGSVLYPGVVVREGVRLGRRVIVHSGAVLGADGFGYAFDGRAHQKIPQVGGVVIEDDVEIGANTTIDRASVGNTTVRKGAKIDNLVQIAHHVTVGEHTVIAAQTGIAGSTQIGNRVILAGQVGIHDHVRVGDGAMVAGQSGITKDVPAGAQVMGFPARPAAEARKTYGAMPRLPELIKTVRALEHRLAALEQRLG
ncbi:MAG TPA: UDP-3-O-(3-hydroxymyristoyl)glucosamine N-acyltransferase [Methylomirabilota bacterium]|nr:UDP-3-O-(3-hydroxymyristoyl)glucosamine N-acyltransferase [Methylomirabilota bacterium]